MKKLAIIILFGICATAYAQVDRDQLSLDISKADAANTEQLKAFMWKKASVVTVDGVEKLTTLSEFSFNEEGELEATNIDAETSVKQKRGIRGRIQQNAAEDNLDYVEKALEVAVAYAFMTKGQLLDFFGKADIKENDGVIKASAKDVFMKGDNLIIKVESATKLFLYKNFSSFVGEDPVEGELIYDKFSSGINHVSKSTLNMPAKKAIINSVNKDYVVRVQ